MQIKKFFSILITFIFLQTAIDCSARNGCQWTKEKAVQWYNSQSWIVGCNYIPSTAINQIEMWSANTYDSSQIDKELTWAEDLGFNSLRVFLSSVVWTHDAKGLKRRMDNFLDICSKHHIRPIFVFFDDCWNGKSAYGPQPAPKPGIHNSGWVQDPSVGLRADTSSLYPRLRAYVRDILKTFRHDKRILMWDLYNEPGNSRHGEKTLPGLRKVFEWARGINPSQPLSAGVWNNDVKINRFILTHSDVVTFHCYADSAFLQHAIDTLRQYGRPLICTEYMARPKSTFQKNMPVLKRNYVGAINWGFVSGKTNTIFAWNKPMPGVKEPLVWFHDIFRQDGTPFDPQEIRYIKILTNKSSM